MRYLLDGSAEHRTTVDTAFGNLDRCHGQVQGMFSGDEWLAGLEPHHGVELCAVVELMFTLDQLVRVFGEGTSPTAWRAWPTTRCRPRSPPT
jgi:hypothetical protein